MRKEKIMTEIIRYATGDSSLGRFVAAESDRGLVSFEFVEDAGAALDALRASLGGALLVEDDAAMAATIRHLAETIDRPGHDAELKLDPRGSEFELRVWNALRQIPAGSTATYGDIAATLGTPRDAREVGEACAANRIAILIPCHRVVKKDGKLAGYRWGFQRKRALLAREQRSVAFQLA
jgi:AraC family transcriptional regulator, regulatory protein of adaptative response / methylated-DNA-[protein]-cysteine methyltransferase